MTPAPSTVPTVQNVGQPNKVRTGGTHAVGARPRRFGGKATATPDDHERDATKRLSQLIPAALPHLLAFDVDDEAHVARGIVPSKAGPARVATMSFEPKSGLLSLEARLGQDPEPTGQRLRACLRLNGRVGLTRAWWDREDGTLWLRAATYCERLDDQAATAMAALAADLFRTLQGEAIRDILEPPTCNPGTGRDGRHEQ